MQRRGRCRQNRTDICVYVHTCTCVLDRYSCEMRESLEIGAVSRQDALGLDVGGITVEIGLAEAFCYPFLNQLINSLSQLGGTHLHSSLFLQSVNPYIVKLSIVDDEATLNVSLSGFLNFRCYLTCGGLIFSGH